MTLKGIKQMSAITKAKVNLKEGTIELEGSEAFVSKQLEVFEKQYQELKKTVATSDTNENTVTDAEKTEPDAKIIKKKTPKVSQPVTPISIDLKAKDNKPSLWDFYQLKKPQSQSERLVVFVYYLKEYLKIEKVEAGHVISCFREVGERIPDVPQMFYDISRNQRWLNLEEGRRFAQLNVAGENFVNHDLPSKDNATKDKEST
jgi:hypothetical protein